MGPDPSDVVANVEDNVAARTQHLPRVWYLLLAASLVLAAVSGAYAAATSFRVTGVPATTPAGTPVPFTVTAVDSSGKVVTNYLGTVRFGCNFPGTILPTNY